MESLALMVAIILAVQLIVAVIAFGLTFTKFKYLTFGFACVSIALGVFSLYTTPQILLPSINILAGFVPIFSILMNLIFEK